jgi:SAM-dependent methyltransferase
MSDDRLTWRQRSCPICGSAPARSWMASNVDLAALDRFAFASRKLPEYMRFSLSLCEPCDLVFADSVPATDWFETSYRDAGFDAGQESGYAALTYAREVRRLLPRLPDTGAALDIGAGDGAFVAQLLDAGFRNVVGIEPSIEPVNRAAPSIRPLLRNDFFRPADFEPESFDLITCFQTLEHVEDPKALSQAVFQLLKPGGMFLTVAHDFRAPLARLLGGRSPIYDIEHLQLFSRASLSALLKSAGYGAIDIQPLSNAYPITYWLKLAPVPGFLKRPLLGQLATSRAGRAVISARVGNLLAAGMKT